MPIKDFIHHYPRALFNDIPRVGAHFYDIPGSGRTLTTYWVGAQFNDIPGSLMLVEDAIGDHTEEAYSIAGLITDL